MDEEQFKDDVLIDRNSDSAGIVTKAVFMVPPTELRVTVSCAMPIIWKQAKHFNYDV